MIKRERYPRLSDCIGKVAIVRNGNRYLILNHYSFGIVLVGQREGDITLPATNFDDKLKNRNDEYFDIMEIRPITSYRDLTDITSNGPVVVDQDPWLKGGSVWKRDEVETLELTIKEIERLVGCPVKIVKEKEGNE